MLSNCKARFVCALVLSAGLLIGFGNLRLAAQGTTGTVLGTVTDSSGGTIPEATIRVTNSGTNATQIVTSDAQGRYRVPDLPVGDYQLQAEKTGFQSVVHTGITLNAGADLVIDFSLQVGQVTQAVTVEGDVTQVETSSSAISSTVEPTQMRDLPLNGRNFEELILLAPGVVNETGAGAAKNSYIGFGSYWSVSGSRANGQGEILDGTSVQDYQDRGSGSGILGTTLGVDAIAEFQMLTNTYGAQYGGNGGIVNAVTRSGTNNYHGSVYEFIRNSALDATTFPATVKQPFQKNQFGGTLGGPVKKDKMFFFVNYEGIRQVTGQTNLRVIPDANALQGFIPATGAPGTCDGPGAPTGYVNCGPGSTNAAKFAIIKPYLNLWSPSSLGTLPVVGNLGNGTEQVQVNANSPAREDYVMGRYDWSISTSDSLFARYLFDNANLTEPFYGSFPTWSNYDRTRNQFTTIGEKHIFSNTLINSLNLGLTRTFLYLHSNGHLGDILDFSGDLTTGVGIPVVDGNVNPGSGIASVGPGAISPVRYAQNKLSVGDDIFWTKGPHSFRFGGGATRVDTNGVHMLSPGGSWTFTSLANFLTDSPNSSSGPCNYYNNEPGCVFSNGTPLPVPSAAHDPRETDFVVYAQDDWKVRPTVTLNLGLRYAPTTNPYDALNQLYQLLPVPFGQNGNLPPAIGTPPPSTLTPIRNFMLKNDSLHNIDPRIGIAWDPFKDHKTSIRAGYGIFHQIMSFRDFRNSSFALLPWSVKTQTAGPFSFPSMNQSPSNSPTTEANGTNPYNTTPYLQQWNLSVQREIMKNTVLTVAYVGSHGVHLLGQRDSNPPIPAGGVTAAGTGAIQFNGGQTVWPSFPGEFAGMISAPVFNSPGGAGSVVFNPNGSVTCNGASAVACSLSSPSGAAILDPATGQQVFSHIVQSSSYSVQANSRVNPNFSFLNNGVTDLWSRYDALQVGMVRRMTNNLSAQVSYTYSNCADISSGDWTQEGGTVLSDAYNPGADRGHCLFMIRHNLTANFLYIFPFQKNRLISGWQLGGILYVSTGGPFDVTTFSNGSSDIGSASNSRANYVPNAPGCNNTPINANYGDTSGISYLNPNCFAAPPVGELGNLARNAFFGPNNITFNPSLVKNTKLSERYNLQFRAEFFNVFNRPNYANPGFPSLQQGASTNATTVVSGSTLPTFGQIAAISNSINGTMRQIQFGLKLLF